MLIKNFVLICFLITFFQNCKSTSSQSNLKVTAGIKIDDAKYPAVQKLTLINWDKPSTCSAVFITPNIALTAAHPVFERNPSEVVLANYNIRPKEIYVHESYTARVQELRKEIPNIYPRFPYKNDIALLKFSEDISIPPLNVRTETLTKGEEVTIVGYGATQYSKKKDPNDPNKEISEPVNFGEKHIGSNVYQGQQWNKYPTMIAIKGRCGDYEQEQKKYKELSEGEMSASAPGDSGGGYNFSRINRYRVGKRC